jgi:PD-(D/E)XK nuclease superfamily protein
MSATRGNATEAAVLNAFVSAGYDVLIPFGDAHPYDLVVDLGGNDFLRVQCKTARPVDGCVVFNGRSTDHGQGRRTYEGRADIFGAYFPPEGRVYLVPVLSNFVLRLRLGPTRNNQRRGVRFAVDYVFERWDLGSLLQVAGGTWIEREAAPEFA